MPPPHGGLAPGTQSHQLQPFQAPSQLTNLPLQGTLILVRFRLRFLNWDPRERDSSRAPPLALPAALSPAAHPPQ